MTESVCCTRRTGRRRFERFHRRQQPALENQSALQPDRQNQPADASPRASWKSTNCRPDARFRIDSIPVDERIAAMVVTDLNGDGQTRHRLLRRRQRPGSDLQPGHERLERSETLAHRGRPDERQRAGRRRFERRRPHRPRFARRQRLALFSAAKCRTTLLASRRKFPIPARQKPCRSWTWTATDKRTCCWWILTARRRSVSGCKMPAASLARKFISRSQPIRSFCADNLEGGAKNYIVTIAQNSGRAEVSEFTRKPAEVLSGALQQGQFQILPLNKTRRGAARPAVGGRERRRPPRFARGRAGKRADFGLFAASRRFAGAAKNFSDARGRDPDCGRRTGTATARRKFFC